MRGRCPGSAAPTTPAARRPADHRGHAARARAARQLAARRCEAVRRRRVRQRREEPHRRRSTTACCPRPDAVARAQVPRVHRTACPAASALCRDEFRKAFEIYPDFALTAAEDGHPIWGRSTATCARSSSPSARRRARKRRLHARSARPSRCCRTAWSKYDAGDYAAAHTPARVRAQGRACKDKTDQVRAIEAHRLHACACRRSSAQCRAEFVKIYDVDPDFDLTPAEAGHPSWTQAPSPRAKAQAQKRR